MWIQGVWEAYRLTIKIKGCQISCMMDLIYISFLTITWASCSVILLRESITVIRLHLVSLNPFNSELIKEAFISFWMQLYRGNSYPNPKLDITYLFSRQSCADQIAKTMESQWFCEFSTYLTNFNLIWWFHETFHTKMVNF